jgi:LEA14-like dessication related protein
MSWILIIALLLLSALVGTGCKQAKDPEFRRLENFGVRNISLQEATIGFEVTYFNPNDFGVNVKETVTDIYIDSVYMGKFSQVSDISVKKNAEFSIPLSGTIPMQKVLGMDLRGLAGKEILLRASGTTRVGKAGIFVTKDIKYQGRHRLDEIKF